MLRAPRRAAAVGATALVPERPRAPRRRRPPAMAKDPADRYPSAGDLGRAALRRRRPTVAGARREPARGRRERTRLTLAGRAAPRQRGVPLPPALAVETGAGPFVGRAELLERARGPLRRRRGRRAPVRRCSPASRGSARRGWRPSSPGATHARRRDRALRPQRPRVARPLPAVHRPRCSTRRAPRAAVALPAELDAGADRAGPLRPGAAPARARAARPARRRRRRRAATACSRRVTRLLAFARPRAPGRAAPRRPALGRRVDRAAARPPAAATPTPMRLLVLGTVRDGDDIRSAELPALLGQLAASRRSSASS